MSWLLTTPGEYFLTALGFLILFVVVSLVVLGYKWDKLEDSEFVLAVTATIVLFGALLWPLILILAPIAGLGYGAFVLGRKFSHKGRLK